MKLIVENRIREKYSQGVPRNSKGITQIVIHGTGGGNSAMAVINWMLGGERENLYKKNIGLFHYEIDLNGDIYEILSPYNGVYHSDSGQFDLDHTIGIELVNQAINNKGIYRPEQYQSLLSLIDFIMDVFPIDSISSHDYNRKYFSNLESKSCPGSLFDWTKITRYLDDTGCKYALCDGIIAYIRKDIA